MWMSCALAPDRCIYFMPCCDARCIMKLYPNNGDAISSFGGDFGKHGKYSGTVTDIDGCVYGILYRSKRVAKYDPINDFTSFVGEEADKAFNCNTNGSL